MSINYIILRDVQDFKYILDESFVLTGALDEHKYEAEHNMWAMGFTDTQALSITEHDLITFFGLLHTRIQRQLRDSGNKFCVTLYVWFDEQAGQLLRFCNDRRNYSLEPLSSIGKILPQQKLKSLLCVIWHGMYLM